MRGGVGTEERRMNREMGRLEWFVVSVVDVDLMRLCEVPEARRWLDGFSHRPHLES